MPGTLLASDWQSSVEDELHRHVTDAINQATQAAQNVAGAIPSIPVPQISAPTVNPQAVLDELNQHVQNIVQTATQVAQPAVVQLGQVQNELQNHVASVLGGAAQGPFTPLNQPQPQQPTSALGQPTITTLGGGSTDATAPLGAPAAAGGDVLGAPSSDTTTAAARGPIDASSPSAFARSIAPYAQYAAQKLGIDPTWVAAMAASESNYGKAAGNELFGVKALPGHKGTTMMTHEGEYGGTAQNATFAAYDTPLDAVNAWIDLIQNHYKGAVGAQDLPSFIHGLKQGGYFTAAEPEYLGIVKGIASTIGGDVQSALQSATQGGPTVPSTAPVTTAQARAADLGYKDISQFGDQQLTPAEAYAACGPAAAVRFAERMGREPTLREATDLAASVGWTPQSGMAGISSEKTLLEKLGVPTKLIQGPQWDVFAKEAQTGNPVTISTYGKNGGHYFFADGYNPDTGAFHVGQSGKDLRGGSEWMTPAQMEALMGSAQGALFADSPVTPVQSSAAAVPSGRPTLGAEAGSPQPQINVPAQQARPPIVMGQNQPVAQLGGDQQQGLTPIQTAQDTVAGVVGDIKRAGQQAVASLQGQAAELGGQVQTQVGGTASQLGTSVRGATDTAGAAAQGAVQNAPDVRQTVAPVLGGAATTVDQVRQQVQNAVDSLPADATVAQVKQVIADTLGAAAPNLGFDDAELQRRRAALDQNEALAARSSTGQPGPITPSSVAGGLAQTAVGPAFGTVQSPEQIRQNTDQVSQALQDNNPVRDVLVVGGLTNTLIDQIVQNPLLFIPGAPMGEALTQAGSTIIGDLAPQLGATAARVSAAALNAGIQNAMYEMGKPDATPISVGTAFLSGAGLGTVIAGSPNVVGDVGRAVLRRVPDLVDAIKPAVSRFAGEELGGAGRPADVALQRARQAVEDLRARFPQMSPGALAASREGKALAALEAGAVRPTPAVPAIPGGLAQTLRALDAYPVDVAARVRAWATSTDATPEEVARTVEQWMAENPTPSVSRPAPAPGARTATDFRAPTTTASTTVAGTRPLTVASAAQGGRPLSAQPSGTTADRLDFLLGRGRYAPLPEPPIPRTGPTDFRPSATTVAGEEPLTVGGGGPIQFPGRSRLGPSPPGTTAARLDELLNQPPLPSGGGPGTRVDLDALAQLRAEGRRQAAAPPPPPPSKNSSEYQDYLLGRGKWADPETPHASLADRALTVGVNGMLGNTNSFFNNALSGLAENVYRPLSTALVRGELGPAWADVRAQGAGIGDALADMATTFTSGRRPSRLGGTDYPEAFPGKVGMLPFTSGNIRVNSAMDEFNRSLGMAGGQAAEMARLMRDNPNLSQADIIARFRDQLTEAGKSAAETATFERGGTPIGDALASARRKLTSPDATPAQRAAGLLTQLVIPFSKIPDVILTRGVLNLPVATEVRGIVNAARAGDSGGVRRAVRQTAVTEAVNAGITWQVLQGNITGNGPSDPAKKQAMMNARDADGNPIWQPNSLRVPTPVGVRWIPYSSLGPVAVRMAAISNLVEQYDEQGKKVSPDMLKATSQAVGETITDAWYLQGVSRIFQALKNGTIADAAGTTLLDFGERYVPDSGLAYELRQYVDPTLRDPQNPLQDVANRVPGLSPLVPPRINPATGEPTQAPRDILSGVVRSSAPGLPDPVNVELARHNLGVGPAPSTISQNKATVTITPDEQRTYDQISGAAIAHDMQATINSPSYQRMSPDQQRTVLEDVVTKARAYAAATVWKQLGKDELVRRMDAYEAAQRSQAGPQFRAPVTAG